MQHNAQWVFDFIGITINGKHFPMEITLYKVNSKKMYTLSEKYPCHYFNNMHDGKIVRRNLDCSLINQDDVDETLYSAVHFMTKLVSPTAIIIVAEPYKAE